MLKITSLKLSSTIPTEQLKAQVAKLLRIPMSDIYELEILKQSIDARKKPNIYFVYSLRISVKNEANILKQCNRSKELKDKVFPDNTPLYHFPSSGTKPLSHPPVVIGSGPAGLFCAYFLAKAGYKPLVLERGKSVEERQKDVEEFWTTGKLNPESNVQFGEGGAGTFSDGKLGTLIKDPDGKNREVLKLFVQFGANPRILYDYKPHIGTDVLAKVIRCMREEIIRLGGTIRFSSKVTDFIIKNNQLTAILVDKETIPCEMAVLAIGHSARDTFTTLLHCNLAMEPKPFSVGFRVQHPQAMINQSQYGTEDSPLGAAPYKVTAKTSLGRGVFSFCMCPGGYVVNASSEEGRIAVNGMSYSGRDGKNANSAIIVTVTPEDYPSDHPLAGMEFQRKMEEKAYQAGQGRIPIQTLGDFKNEILPANTEVLPMQKQVEPQIKGQYTYASLKGILPAPVEQALVEGMEVFAHQIDGFNRPDTILAAVESRTSSPVRIPRNDNLEASIKGIYPCGEGAGYAGGITSAAMDGIKVAEFIAKEYAPIG